MDARLKAIFILVGVVLLAYFVYSTQAEDSRFAYKLGLDLRGGTQLVYRALVDEVPSALVGESMAALRDVIERRVNLFGVVEPNVQTQTVSLGIEGNEERLIVELPGVTNTEEAIALIGQTPILEFKTERPEEERKAILAKYEELRERQEAGEDISMELAELDDPFYVDTELTGRFLS